MADEDETPDEDENEAAEDQNEDGDGDDDDDDEGDGPNKMVLIAIAAVALLLAAGAGLYFSGMLDSVLGKADAEMAEGEHGGGDKHAKKDDGHGGGHDDGHGGGGASFLEIPTITVNLYADDGTPRYLRLTVQLEVASEEDKAAVEAVIPRVIDKFQTYLRELRVRDLRGSAGIYRLQMELLWRVNQAAAPAEVKKVLFQEILIQ